MGERLALWLDSLREEMATARSRFETGGDKAAAAFVALLEDVLREHESALNQYVQATAPVEDRFRWLQIVGAGLGALVYYFERLDGAIAPRLSPLVSAFERLLVKLIPGHPAVFRQFRDFNYELSPIHSGEFKELISDPQKHSWPALLIKFPVGILDSPRNHILVGHEIGHAIAVVRAEANRHPAPDSPSPIPLLVGPAIPPARLMTVISVRWREVGFGNLKVGALPKRGIPAVLLASVTASIASKVDDMAGRWMEELFADAVGTCLFGPAFVLALIDVLLPISGLEQPDEDHPSGASRLLFIEALLSRPELAGIIDAVPSRMRVRLDGILEMSRSMVAAVPPSTGRSGDDLVFDLVDQLVGSKWADIQQAAIDSCRDLIYTGAQLREDLSDYLKPLVSFGVPPISDLTGRSTSLACIFNVAQVVALDAIETFRPDLERVQKERVLDDLILKAVELAEIQTMWGEG